MFYSGIDLHKNNCFITTIDKDGLIVRQAKLPNEEHVILNYFFSIGNIHKAVVESTSNWYWLSDLLRNHQIDLTLAHAKYLKAISYAKVKTDKVDSQTLAQLLRMNLIPTAHQISPDKRGVRAVQYYKEIKQFYHRKARTTNKPIAKTIVAKELARITYHVIKD